jgi:hypothetical protein
MYFLGNHLFTRPKWAIHLGLRKLRRNVYFLGVEDLAIMCSHNQWVEHLWFPNIFSWLMKLGMWMVEWVGGWMGSLCH